MASMYRLPRNAICAACYEGAKAIIAFFNDDDDEHADADQGSVKPSRLTKLNSTIKVRPSHISFCSFISPLGLVCSVYNHLKFSIVPCALLP